MGYYDAADRAGKATFQAASRGTSVTIEAVAVVTALPRIEPSVAALVEEARLVVAGWIAAVARLEVAVLAILPRVEHAIAAEVCRLAAVRAVGQIQRDGRVVGDGRDCRIAA